MLFNSYTFICAFLPVTLLLYFGIARRFGHRLALAWITLASLFFYAWWNPPYVLLIVLSMLVNYGWGQYLVRTAARPGWQARRKALMVAAVSANLGLLGYFKYANFFVDTVSTALGAGWTLETIILPLGISFFTFEQLGYVVDAYRAKARPYSFLEYVFFVTFFPHLIAGPIINHHELLDQLQDRRVFTFSPSNFATGVTLFVLGLFKKVMIADHLAGFASPAFNGLESGTAPAMVEAWIAVFAYSLQLYFDFSGYSDMAAGLACMVNLKLPVNFNSPYKAINPIDFWRRWHMTLSRFLRDYLYIPLGGSRGGTWLRHRNLMITMLLGGLWHGAGWGFVIWGGLNGLFLLINHAWRSLRGAPPLEQDDARGWSRELSITVTFVAIALSRVFFRAVDWQSSMLMLEALAGGTRVESWDGMGQYGGAVVACLVAYGVTRWAPNSQELLAHRDAVLAKVRTGTRLRWGVSAPWAALTAAMATAALLGLTQVSEFLYFQF